MRLSMSLGLHLKHAYRQIQYSALFISYHHQDHAYREAFEKRFFTVKLFNDWRNQSVNEGSIDPALPDEYIRRLIREQHIENSTLMVVLLGTRTFSRKHVDWEIAGGSRKHCALMGVLLPEFPRDSAGVPILGYIPPRLRDNLDSGYATLFSWGDIFDASTDEKIMAAFRETAAKGSAGRRRNGRTRYLRNRSMRNQILEMHET